MFRITQISEENLIRKHHVKGHNKKPASMLLNMEPTAVHTKDKLLMFRKFINFIMCENK